MNPNTSQTQDQNPNTPPVETTARPVATAAVDPELLKKITNCGRNAHLIGFLQILAGLLLLLNVVYMLFVLTEITGISDLSSILAPLLLLLPLLTLAYGVFLIIKGRRLMKLTADTATQAGKDLATLLYINIAVIAISVILIVLNLGSPLALILPVLFLFSIMSARSAHKKIAS